jgi:DNA invertase Pin-like site-specific DNA recombinase
MAMRPPNTHVADSPAPLGAVAYLRRSTDRQEQSLDDQRTAIKVYAAERALTIIREYVDDAISGSTSEGRDAFQRLIADAQRADPDFDMVLVYDVKRFGRVDTDEAGHFRYLLRKRGVEVMYVAEGFSGDDSDDLIRPVKQWQARQELKDLSKVTIRGQVSLCADGWWLGGVPPYGYDLMYYDASGKPFQQVRFTISGEKLLLDPEGKLVRTVAKGQRLQTAKTDHARLVPGDPKRVKTVKRIFDLYVHHGHGYKPIAHLLNSDGVPSPRNVEWSSNHEGHWAMSTIRAILVNLVYTGSMVWNRRTYGKFFRVSNERAAARPLHRLGRGEVNPESDWIVVPDTHAALVPRDVFDVAKALRARREGDRNLKASRGGRSKTSPFLLSGLLKCTDCGHNFQGYRVNKGQTYGGPKVETYYYICGGYRTKGTAVCQKHLFPREMIESYVLERIGARLQEFMVKGGRSLLEQIVKEEVEPKNGSAEEVDCVRLTRDAIRQKIDTLLDSLTPTNKEFIDEKLRNLKAERDRLEARLIALDAPMQHVDVQSIVDDGIARLAGLGQLLAHGGPLERKTLVQAFLTRIEISPRDGKGTAHFARLPVGVGISSFAMVAGAGFEPATFGL